MMKKQLLTLICGLVLATLNINAQGPWNIGTPTATDVVATLVGNTLTISGTGAIANTTVTNPTVGGPWNAVAADIHEVIVEDGVTTIGNFLFASLPNLTTVTIAGTITTFPSGGMTTFWGNPNLTTVILEEGITAIPASFVSQMPKLTSVTIPSTVTSIGNNAFSNCPELTSITLPEGLTSLGNDMFFNCTKLSGEIVIPDGITAIGSQAFRNCRALESITLPDGLLTIGDNAFRDCRALGSINLPDGLLTIGSNAFQNCRALTYIIIPASVTEIKASAFANCNVLSAVKVLWDTPLTIPTNVWASSGSGCIFLYVPEGTVEDYENAEVWEDFCLILEEGQTPKEVFASLKDNIATLEGQVEDLEGQIEDLEGQIEELDEQIEGLEAALAACQAELEDCQNNTSTAPYIPMEQVNVYPNPTTNLLNIVNFDWTAGDVVKLFDMNGKRVYMERVSTPVETLTIDMNNFQTGNYILQIGNRVAKVVKQ